MVEQVPDPGPRARHGALPEGIISSAGEGTRLWLGGDTASPFVAQLGPGLPPRGGRCGSLRSAPLGSSSAHGPGLSPGGGSGGGGSSAAERGERAELSWAHLSSPEPPELP